MLLQSKAVLPNHRLLALVFFFLSASTALYAQSEDSVSTGNYEPSTLYHILFDDSLSSRIPVILHSSSDGVTVFEGRMTELAVSDRNTEMEISDSAALRFVDIRLSDLADYAEIDRIAPDTVTVKVYERDRSTRSKRGAPYFEESFDACHTNEIRLHLRGGDDYAIVRGTVNSSILIRVIGDEGSDEMVDSSHVTGYVLHILPIKKDERKTYFYGEPNETNFIYSPSTVVRSISESEDSLFGFRSLRDWGHSWSYHPIVAYSSDNGALIGASVSMIDYNFHADPCQNILTLSSLFGTQHSRYDIAATGWFPQTLGGALSLSLKATTFAGGNFFGYGNETLLDNTAFDADRYVVNERLIEFSPKFEIGIFENTMLWGSASLRNITTDANAERDTTFLRRRHQYGVGTQSTLRLSYGITFDSRDELRAATKGIYAGFQSSWTPEILDNQFAYMSLIADIRAYLSADILTPMTLALRLKADKLFGEHPFYESAFIGGANTVRGFYLDRFAGEASYFGSAEWRIRLGEVKVFVPTTIGLFLLADAGRVYIDNDFSGVWHTSFGGGLSVAPVSPVHTFTITIAHSTEATQLYVGTGFAF